MIFDIFAWAFLARAPYPSSIYYGVKKFQLFLIAGEGPDATNIQNIMIAEGYIQLGNAPNRPDRLQALSIHLHNPQTDTLVLLHVTENTPLYHVFRKPLTCSMCFVTWEKAYCLFPISTLEKREAYTTKRTHSLHGISALSRAWGDAGMTMMPVPFDMHRTFSRQPTTGHSTQSALSPNEIKDAYVVDRYVDDFWSLVIQLDTTVIAPPARPLWLTNYASFRVCPYLAQLPYYAVCRKLIRSVALEYEYTVSSNKAAANSSSPEAVEEPLEMQRMGDLAIMQLQTLDAQHRPANFHRLIRVNGSINWHRLTRLHSLAAPVCWTKLAGWKHYDGEMTRILTERYERLAEELGVDGT